jgi:hypothetical protein
MCLFAEAAWSYLISSKALLEQILSNARIQSDLMCNALTNSVVRRRRKEVAVTKFGFRDGTLRVSWYRMVQEIGLYMQEVYITIPHT